MDRLRKLDDIAYIRFASVYRSYPDIQAMRQEMDHLLDNGQPASGQPTGGQSAPDSVAEPRAGAAKR